MSRKDNLINGLLHERAGYLRTGRRERVRAVEAELKRLGHDVEPAFPVGRSARPLVTAEESKPVETAEASVEVEPSDEQPKRRGRPRLPRDEDGNIVRG